MFVFKVKWGRSGGYFQTVYFCQRIDNSLCDAIAKVFDFLAITPVREGKNGDGIVRCMIAIVQISLLKLGF